MPQKRLGATQEEVSTLIKRFPLIFGYSTTEVKAQANTLPDTFAANHLLRTGIYVGIRSLGDVLKNVALAASSQGSKDACTLL